jgi:undecaprenyl-diphosphatase
MDFLQILTLSIVQGITEFLPISSSAHLVLVPYLAKWQDQGQLFDISVHIGTLFAVMIYFKKEVFQLLYGTTDIAKRDFKTKNASLVYLLIISTIPLLLLGFFMKDIVQNYTRSLQIIAFTSIFYAFLLYWADTRCSQKKHEVTSKKDAFIFGIFQMLSIIPGTSRSGICMTAGRYLGFSRDESTRYAMLMSIPAIIAVGGYGALKALVQGDASIEPWDFILGVGFSFISAYAIIWLLMKWIVRIGFMPFIIYRIALGCLLFYLASGAA